MAATPPGASPRGSTRVAGVIGDPIAHSLSPVILNAAFGAAGLDWVYVALPTPAGDAPAAVAGMRALGIRGLSVTMPHKEAVIPALDGLSEVAERLGAVNCIRRDPTDDRRLIGDNTDGAGFLGGLRADFDLDPAGRRCVVLGAGGAARAVVLALAGAGAARVEVVNRSRDRAEQAVALAGPVGALAGPEAVAGADLVVNATPVGMGDSGGVPCDPDRLGPGQVVAELVYHPLETPLMAAAAARGARVANGVSMLVHQAARAFELWTGGSAPVQAMTVAARSALAG